MTGEAAEPTEPTSAKDLHDEIVAMFDEALARKFRPRLGVSERGQLEQRRPPGHGTPESGV